MLTFTQIPAQGAPLGGELRYTVGAAGAGTFDIRICDAAGTLLGAKRLAGVAEASFDAAPYLRRAAAFTPVTGGTGFHDAAGRTVTAVVAVTYTADGSDAAEESTAPGRTFLPVSEAVAAPALLTALPRQRLIAPGECDELTLLCDGPCSVLVTAEGGASVAAQSYAATGSGLHVFRLDTRDFPDAATLTVDAGACGEVSYTLLGAFRGAQRLAWRTAEGSVEHYTFPIERSVEVAVEKQRAQGAAGYVPARIGAERRTVLGSAYEVRAVLDALAGVLSSPVVWRAEGDAYTAVDVMSERAVTHRHGEMGCLEIEVRPVRKICLPWS